MAALTPDNELPDRDRQVVKLVAKFRQMTTGQIRDSLFADLASVTPLERTLKRLVYQKHLSRLQRLIGGDKGGSGQYVYQLGRAGWKLLDKPGAYWVPRAVNLHTLAVADCYVTLKQAEHAGEIQVLVFTTEPECHETIGGVVLTPDAYLELGIRAARIKYSYWLEVDRGTEHVDKIQEKCIRYWKAYTRVDAMRTFPYVLFIVPDKQRERAIEHVIHAGPSGAQELFAVCPVAQFPRLNQHEKDLR